jgi:uncharacterized protein (DUF1697 family)
MDRLRALIEELGFEAVSTFIASGNVVFSTESTDIGALTESIEGHLESALGYSVPAFLRTNTRLGEIAKLEWPDAIEGSDADTSHYVTFLRAPAEDGLRVSLDALSTADDTFRYEGREIHWLIRGKVSDSPLFGGSLEKTMRGVPNTMRNMTSVRRMAGKYT